MQVYRATDPSGQLWRIEITDPPDVRVKILVAFDDGTVSGVGQRLSGIGPLGKWLVEHGMTEADLRPW